MVPGNALLAAERTLSLLLQAKAAAAMNACEIEPKGGGGMDRRGGGVGAVREEVKEDYPALTKGARGFDRGAG